MSVDDSSIDRHWQNLATIVQRSPLCSINLLKQPAPVSAPPVSFVREIVKFCTTQKQRELVQRHILSASVLFENQNKQLQELQLISGFCRIFPDIPLKELQAVTWLALPIAVVQGGRGVKITTLLGLKSGSGKCVVQQRPQISKVCLEILELSVPPDKDLFIWTLQHESDSPITGHSLGLPLAIGLFLLQQGSSWPEKLLVTGALMADGHVSPVQNIKEKKQLLDKNGGMLLVPLENITQDFDERLVAVRTVAEAISVVNYLLQDIHDSQTIRLLQWVVQDADNFLDGFHKLPPAFFTLHDFSAVFKKIQNSPGKYLGKLTLCLRNKKSLTQLPYEMVHLFSHNEIWVLAQSHPFSALQYSLAQLSFQNHSGRADSSKEWHSLAKKIATSCDARKELSSLANNDFVSRRFNRYDFRVELPELFKRRLVHEEQLHELQEDDSRQLGAMYGTLAQNYGFCGPLHFEKLEKMTAKAIAAFGRRNRDEHPRILSYLLYGFLDSDEFARANTLFSRDYLRSDNHPAIWIKKTVTGCDRQQNCNPFTLALLCRLLADQPGLLDRCSWKDSRQNLVSRVLNGNKHPWQLIAVNLARCCLFYREKKQAERLLNHAVSVCANHGATIRAMGLLPLALLYKHDLFSILHSAIAKQIVTAIQEQNNLEQSHFSDLFCCDSGEEILGLTEEKKRTMFPFSYR